LGAVFDLVEWWTAENRTLERARKALRLRNIYPSDNDERSLPSFPALPIRQRLISGLGQNGHACCGTPLAYKPHSEPLEQFIQRNGGINECAEASANLTRHNAKFRGAVNFPSYALAQQTTIFTD
jgi:hypothetical protein